jgi:DNA-binding MarR family transcriptional regulator
VLELDSPLLQSDIRERSRLSKRTTRHAIALLKEDGLVDERVHLPDARKRTYRPVPVTD